MQAGQPLSFGSYRLDLANARLWRGKQVVALPPKALAVLQQLAERPGQLVTKEALFEAVWPGVVVSDGALTICIKEIRKALHDERQAPRYIETVHRRGYRFIGKVASSQHPVVSRQHPQPASSTQHPAPTLVGREVELGQLQSWLDNALSGERQIVFVTGEPGIGKTSVVDTFVKLVASKGDLWIGYGQCIEHFGAGEAYLPVLAALDQVGREPDGQRLVEILGQYAPTWLGQMPALLNQADLEMLQRKTAGATKERMLRELTEALEVLTAERGLVLWLEDLQWSDVSTLDWLAFVARRRGPCRLLVLGTYRPVEVIMRDHPLKTVKQELQLHAQCEELPLGCLSEAAVAEYLAVRFSLGTPGRVLLQGLARAIHQRTDGNPLFMVNVVNDLIARGAVRQTDGQ